MRVYRFYQLLYIICCKI